MDRAAVQIAPGLTGLVGYVSFLLFLVAHMAAT